jgi:hypothetical protein
VDADPSGGCADWDIDLNAGAGLAENGGRNSVEGDNAVGVTRPLQNIWCGVRRAFLEDRLARIVAPKRVL